MTTPSATFDSLGLAAPLLTALTRLGYEEPTPIQREAIPPLLAGRDVLGQAATGTGKTAAFALPMLSGLTVGRCRQFETSALVLVPTRELALQVTEAIRNYGGAMGVSVIAVYGGEEIGRQLKPLRRGVDVVVATPGRAIDHLKRKSLLLDKVTMVVLDEADEMLDMGFADDLELILRALPLVHQTALFSATMPSRIVKIAERHLKSPVRVSIARQVVAAGEAPRVRQTAYVVPRRFKTVALTRIFQLEHPQSALIFCRTRDEVDELSSVLIQQGEPAAALHGGLTQDQRDRVMKKFKTGAVKFLVATDVAARGLHIENLTHVVNYDVPNSPEAYVHRIGRTGRAGREGAAITLTEPQETRLLQGLERAVGAKIAIATVPTPDELRGRQLQQTRQAVLEAARVKSGAAMREWIEQLGGDPAPTDLAAAAIELLHQAHHGAAAIDEVQIPVWAGKPGAPKGPPSHPSRHPQGGRHEKPDRPAHPARPSRPAGTQSFDRPPKLEGGGRTSQPSHSAAPPRPSRPKAEKLDRATHVTRPERGEKFDRPARAARPERGEKFARPAHAARPERGENYDRPPLTTGARHGPPQRIVRAYEQPEPSRGFQKRHDGSPIAKRHDGAAEKVNVWFGAGERSGIRPGDLVGAIANEAHLDSKLIGPIQIREAYSLVGVPKDLADRIISVMQKTTLRGRKVPVRRDR